LPLVKNFRGRLQRAMGEQLSPPVEQIGFAGIELCRTLIFAHRFERMPELLFNVGQLVMKAGIFRTLSHCVAQRTLGRRGR